MLPSIFLTPDAVFGIPFWECEQAFQAIIDRFWDGDWATAHTINIPKLGAPASDVFVRSNIFCILNFV